MNQFQLQLAIAKETLAKADPILAKVISIHGPCKLRPHNNYFQELVSSIISQQLSTKAAATVWYRFLAIFNDTMPTPNQVIGTKTEVFRSAGLSYQKCLYLKDLAVNIENKNVIFSHLTQQSNNDIVEQITKVKGIGLWSAQMFLIFSLGRLDVLPCGDYGIRKSASELY